MSALWLTVAFLAGVAITWVIRNLGRTLGMVSQPNAIATQHRLPVPYTGGIAIALTILVVTLAAQAVAGRPALIPTRVWIPATLFLLLGVIDDLRPLGAVTKILLQVAASASAIALDLRWYVTGIDAVDIAISLAWFVLMVNAFNVTDVCDGLVGGLTVIMLAFVATRADTIWVPLVTMGAVLGFLVFNRPPATVFLGDGGSHLLGFLVAACLLPVVPDPAAVSWKHVAAAAVATGVVLVEVVLLMYSRTRAGIPWWRGSPHHFSLRLQAHGLSRLATDMVAWSAAIALCVIAWFLPRIPDAIALGVTLVVALALLAVCRFLLRWNVR
jgi:UDP-GlcNAc:undecaprenyl-phosphate GlcNAc-1-phosphate transferase